MALPLCATYIALPTALLPAAARGQGCNHRGAGEDVRPRQGGRPSHCARLTLHCCVPVAFNLQLHEDAIIEGLEKMCDPDKEAGEWLTKIDIVEDGDQLKLVEMDEVSGPHHQQSQSTTCTHSFSGMRLSAGSCLSGSVSGTAQKSLGKEGG
eukprot:1158546-Pelagomonas_calceolata.AAC.3